MSHAQKFRRVKLQPGLIQCLWLILSVCSAVPSSVYWFNLQAGFLHGSKMASYFKLHSSVSWFTEKVRIFFLVYFFMENEKNHYPGVLCKSFFAFHQSKLDHMSNLELVLVASAMSCADWLMSVSLMQSLQQTLWLPLNQSVCS